MKQSRQAARLKQKTTQDLAASLSKVEPNAPISVTSVMMKESAGVLRGGCRKNSFLSASNNNTTTSHDDDDLNTATARSSSMNCSNQNSDIPTFKYKRSSETHLNKKMSHYDDSIESSKRHPKEQPRNDVKREDFSPDFMQSQQEMNMLKSINQFDGSPLNNNHTKSNDHDETSNSINNINSSTVATTTDPVLKLTSALKSPPMIHVTLASRFNEYHNPSATATAAHTHQQQLQFIQLSHQSSQQQLHPENSSFVATIDGMFLSPHTQHPSTPVKKKIQISNETQVFEIPCEETLMSSTYDPPSNNNPPALYFDHAALHAHLSTQSLPIRSLAWVLDNWLGPVDVDDLINSLGSLMSLLYTSICAACLSIFNCYNHPSTKNISSDNGDETLWSMRILPHVLCFSNPLDSTWSTILLPLGIFFSILFALGFWVLVLFVNIKAPVLSNPALRGEKAYRFVARFSFLFSRYRHDMWWWDTVVLVRNLLLSMIPAIFFEAPIQLIMFLAVVIIAAIAQTYYNPLMDWTTNFLEICCLLCLALFAAGGLYFAAVESSGQVDALYKGTSSLVSNYGDSTNSQQTGQSNPANTSNLFSSMAQSAINSTSYHFLQVVEVGNSLTEEGVAAIQQSAMRDKLNIRNFNSGTASSNTAAAGTSSGFDSTLWTYNSDSSSVNVVTTILLVCIGVLCVITLLTLIRGINLKFSLSSRLKLINQRSSLGTLLHETVQVLSTGKEDRFQSAIRSLNTHDTASISDFLMIAKTVVIPRVLKFAPPPRILAQGDLHSSADGDLQDEPSSSASPQQQTDGQTSSPLQTFNHSSNSHSPRNQDQYQVHSIHITPCASEMNFHSAPSVTAPSSSFCPPPALAIPSPASQISRFSSFTPSQQAQQFSLHDNTSSNQNENIAYSHSKNQPSSQNGNTRGSHGAESTTNQFSFTPSPKTSSVGGGADVNRLDDLFKKRNSRSRSNSRRETRLNTVTKYGTSSNLNNGLSLNATLNSSGGIHNNNTHSSNLNTLGNNASNNNNVGRRSSIFVDTFSKVNQLPLVPNPQPCPSPLPSTTVAPLSSAPVLLATTTPNKQTKSLSSQPSVRRVDSSSVSPQQHPSNEKEDDNLLRPEEESVFIFPIEISPILPGSEVEPRQSPQEHGDTHTSETAHLADRMNQLELPPLTLNLGRDSLRFEKEEEEAKSPKLDGTLFKQNEESDVFGCDDDDFYIPSSA
eukprot:GDKJ01024113.1.p1 GENE.GDKJ01024113.1~~GDKJ01024113.1.p1  ORF type:complete len:1249 (-),score=340.59 GDKJ01024113.1:1189-4824(-)